MANGYELTRNIVVTICFIVISMFAFVQMVAAYHYRNDIYDLWNTIGEFEETYSLRTFLLDSDWISDRTKLDELDYILVLVQQCSREFFPEVPTSLVLSVISVESGFRSDILGFNDDTGLMQIIPRYHRERIEKYLYDENVDLFDPRLNIMVGMDYLSELLKKFDGDIYTTLMAYNMGPDRARTYASNGWTSGYADICASRMDAFEEFFDGR